MREVRDYWQTRRGVIGLYLLFVAVFAVTFALYHLPLKAVWYPAALCAVIGLIVMALDFLRIRRTRRAIGAFRSMTDVDALHFPPPVGAVEADYQTLLRLLAREQAEWRTQSARRYDDMVDYYTVWAHQIKTPIAAMRLTLQNEDSPLSRRVQSDLFRIEQYVEMVMMFLRLESPSTDYLIRDCDLDTIVRQAVRKFASEFIARRLELRYEPLSATVLTDEKWLAFVVEQVLSNALKYTPAGSVTITLEAPQTLCIRDTGMGIAPEDLPRIFEKGYTGCRGRADKQASGIGLYLCRRICRSLGHTIWAESVPEKGTAVYIDLRRQEVEVE